MCSYLQQWQPKEQNLVLHLQIIYIQYFIQYNISIDAKICVDLDYYLDSATASDYFITPPLKWDIKTKIKLIPYYEAIL